MSVHDSLLDLIGGTPLVRLRRLTDGITARVLLKLEYLNPGGSVKDRAAVAMVLDAERSGALAPGGTIVEATSGNTGIGLAQVAAVRGYRIVVVVPDTIAVEKTDILRAYGADVVRTKAGLPRDHPDHVSELAGRIAAETHGGWLADQYDNGANPAAHRATTGPEIWADTGGSVTHLVASIGTGGTITGTGEYLTQVSDGRVQVVGADPVTSVYNGGDGSPFFVEAAGHYLHPDTPKDVWPLSYHPEVVDHVEAVPDRESVTTVRRLAREEGLLVGGSSGLVTAAALRVARGLGPEHTVVAILPDSGRAYLSKYHSPQWLRRFGFLDDDRPGLLGDAGLAGPVHTVTTETSLADAAALAAGAARGQAIVPVVLPRRDPRFATAVSEILGVLHPASLAAEIARHGPHTPVGGIAGPPPLALGTGETVAEAAARLDDDRAAHAVLVRDGRLAGLVSRSDLAHRG
ncbi:MAG: pyridoxal-phosphate dependent enzyme [Pseudonocardia sp.]|nr:pyridoxal-phosphate dependent enzyme [Pseudonocardia sp.]